jgi:hypothetical protein
MGVNPAVVFRIDPENKVKLLKSITFSGVIFALRLRKDTSEAIEIAKLLGWTRCLDLFKGP